MRLFLLLFGAVYTSVGIAFFLTRLPALVIVIGGVMEHTTEETEECESCGEKHHFTWIEAAIVILDVTARAILFGALWPYSIYRAFREIG